MFARYICLCALSMAISTSSRAEVTPQQFTPEWSVGSTWTIQTTYRNIDAGDAGGGKSWSKPVNFQYTVTDKHQDGDRALYTIRAMPWEQGSGFATTITVATDAAGHASIQKVDAQHRLYGKIVTDRTNYDGAPAFTDNSIIPYDAPIFPLERPSRLHTAGFLAPTRAYTRVRNVGGLSFAQHPSQRLKSLAGQSSYVDRQGATVDFKVPVTARDVYPVELEEVGTGQHVVQYWAQGQPWFVYSENNSSRSWLIQPNGTK